MHPSRRAAAAAALAALSLSLAACGGGDDDGPATLAKADLVKQADAICKPYDAQLKDIDGPQDMTDPAQATAFFAKVVPLAVEQQEKLEALKPADDVQSDWDAFVAVSRKGTDLLTAIRKKAEAKDASGLQDLQKLEPISKEVDRTADVLGLKDCRDS